MAGVWVFKNGVVRLQEGGDPSANLRQALWCVSGEDGGEATEVDCYSVLETKLVELGWVKNTEDESLLQYSKGGELISLPTDFSMFKGIHMYQIKQKNPEAFKLIKTSE